MNLLTLTLLLLVFFTSNVICKGGGGRGGGGGRAGRGGHVGGGIGGGSSGGGGGSSSGGSSGSSGSKGSPGMSRPGTARVPNVGRYHFPASSNTYTKGGYGGFAAGAPNQKYSNTRYTYTQYNPTYSGGYSSDRRSGWIGTYNPSMVYWALVPAWGFAGYYYAYHRYNPDGAYYAPELSVSGNGTQNAIIQGVEYTSEDDNYRYIFNMTTNYGYPMADHAFIASSDPDAHPADFAFRLAFAHIIEFDDVNQNGFYDDNEPLMSVVSFENATWQPFQISLRQAESNASLTYYEFSTIGQNLTRDSQQFEIQLIWRSTNLQINMTEGVPLQPNSLQYDLKLIDYPMPSNPTHRLAIAQVLTTPPSMLVTKDVNSTTPIDVANQIKTNETYGASLGDYSEARLEYQSTANITEVGTHPEQAGIPNDTNSANWIWREELSQRQNRLLYVTIPSGNVSQVPSLSGFAFLDTNVMNAMAAEYPRSPSGGEVPWSSAPRAIPYSVLAIMGTLLTVCALL